MQPARALFADAIFKTGAIVSLLGWFFFLLLAVGQKNVWLMLLFTILGLLAACSRWYFMDPMNARHIRRETAYDRARQAADRLSPSECVALHRYLDPAQ